MWKRHEAGEEGHLTTVYPSFGMRNFIIFLAGIQILKVYFLVFCHKLPHKCRILEVITRVRKVRGGASSCCASLSEKEGKEKHA
jgi:hypothetical protein